MWQLWTMGKESIADELVVKGLLPSFNDLLVSTIAAVLVRSSNDSAAGAIGS
jgi:hypothetical protein